MAESLAFAAALMVRLPLEDFARFTLAHLLLAAAAMRARPAALMVLPECERWLPESCEVLPRIRVSSF